MIKFMFIVAASFVFASLTSVILQHFGVEVTGIRWLVGFILYMVLGYKAS